MRICDSADFEIQTISLQTSITACILYFCLYIFTQPYFGKHVIFEVHMQYGGVILVCSTSLCNVNSKLQLYGAGVMYNY